MALIDNILAKNDIDSVALNIAKSLTSIRKERKFSREYLSQKSGVSYGSLRRFEESGEISLKNLLKIARFLDHIHVFSELFKPQEFKSMDELRKSTK